jgi:hypothetical protein
MLPRSLAWLTERSSGRRRPRGRNRNRSLPRLCDYDCEDDDEDDSEKDLPRSGPTPPRQSKSLRGRWCGMYLVRSGKTTEERLLALNLRQTRRAGEALRACTPEVHRMHTGGTPEVHRKIPCASGVPPVYLRCTQREGPENRAVRSEMNPKSAGLPRVYLSPTAASPASARRPTVWPWIHAGT